MFPGEVYQIFLSKNALKSASRQNISASQYQKYFTCKSTVKFQNFSEPKSLSTLLILINTGNIQTYPLYTRQILQTLHANFSSKFHFVKFLNYLCERYSTKKTNLYRFRSDIIIPTATSQTFKRTSRSGSLRCVSIENYYSNKILKVITSSM